MEIGGPPSGMKVIGCKWFFTVKFIQDLVGNKKIHPDYRVNYQETFTLVAKLHTVHVLLSLAANQKWQLHKLDVKNSFLNGDLEEATWSCH
ncbi:hypothetical protein CK203_087471 [Vitis vinifera]|uniref:Reverse transcriptase Ty1/copia-type domain-containing protein n=1 Tax=Vitis vinifera TaxID=29760 RepID=A0A438EN41_VITVI|nr:hypothetical protein CK203_087471 [Vitis vinifera]